MFRTGRRVRTLDQSAVRAGKCAFEGARPENRQNRPARDRLEWRRSRHSQNLQTFHDTRQYHFKKYNNIKNKLVLENNNINGVLIIIILWLTISINYIVTWYSIVLTIW